MCKVTSRVAYFKLRNAQKQDVLGTAFKVFPYKKLAVWAIVINFVCVLLRLDVGQNVPNALCAGC